MQNIFIRKRGNKHVVTLEYRDTETGKKKQKALSSHDKSQDAKKALTQEKKKLYDGDFIIPDKLTFSNYMIDWVEQHKINLSPTTHERYKLLIVNDVVPYFKDLELQKFKANFYSIHEVKQLIEAVKDNRLESPLHLAIALGLRAGEILGLRWSDIDSKTHMVTINQSLIRGKTEDDKPNFKVPKSDTSLRVLTAPAGLIKILESYKKKQLEMQVGSYGDYKNEYNLVFTAVDGRPMASDSFSRLFRDFLKRKNLP